MQEITQVSKAILNERGRPLSERITVPLSAQCTASIAMRPSFGILPFHGVRELERRSSFAALVKDELELTELDEGDCRSINRVSSTPRKHKETVRRREACRESERERRNRRELPHFTVGDFVQAG